MAVLISCLCESVEVLKVRTWSSLCDRRVAFQLVTPDKYFWIVTHPRILYLSLPDHYRAVSDLDIGPALSLDNLFCRGRFSMCSSRWMI